MREFYIERKDNGDIELRFKNASNYIGTLDSDINLAVELVRTAIKTDDTHNAVCLLVFTPQHLRLSFSKTDFEASIQVFDEHGKEISKSPCDLEDLLVFLVTEKAKVF